MGSFLIGLFLVLWARWALGAMYGVSTGSYAPLQERHRLIQRGPYAFIRHPMYLGYWLVILGILLAYRTWTPLALLAMTVPSFYLRARRNFNGSEIRIGMADLRNKCADVPAAMEKEIEGVCSLINHTGEEYI